MTKPYQSTVGDMIKGSEEGLKDELLDQDTTDELEETQEDVTDELVDTKEPEVKKAKQHGYLSKEEYIAKYGTAEGFKTPEQFNKFGESYDEVKDLVKGLKKKLDQRDRENEAVVRYLASVKEREYARARQEIEREILNAKQQGDVNAVAQWTQEKSKLDYQEAYHAAQQAQTQTQQEAQQAMDGFIERNSHWYGKDPEMTQRAQQLDAEIRSGAYSHMFPQPQSYEQLARQVEAIIKQEYRDQTAPVQPRHAPVFNTSNNAVNKSVSTARGTDDKRFDELMRDSYYKDLYKVTKRVYEKTGDKYTPQDFIKQLKKDGEI